MSFANDQLFKGYFRRNMATIASTVKVREIVPHLPCLTDHDRENIEAKKETCGNYDSMVLLLDCLKRRQSWPEQFIQALEMCELSTLAAEIRAEYNALRGTNSSSPNSPSTTVVRAHVHAAPSASHLSMPEGGGNNHAAVSVAAEPSAPSEPSVQVSPPHEAPQSSAAQIPEAVPQPEPPQSTQTEVAAPPSTPPPSPEPPHTQEAVTPPPLREISSHLEPVENSESDILDICDDHDGQASVGNGDVSADSVDAPQPSCPVEPTPTEVRPPRSPSPTSDVTDESSGPMMTPEKPPIQDTAPPECMKPADVLQPGQTSELAATQVVESSPQTSPLPPAAGMEASLCDDTLCLSKPGQLISIEPQNHNLPTLPAPSLPYSGNSERLELSEAAESSAHVPACSAVLSATVDTLTVMENGIAPNHNEPEENYYETPGQSLEMQDVREHVWQISEEPSILNLDGQSSATQAQIINGEAAKEITCAPSSNAAGSVPSVNIPSSESHPPSEPAPADVSAQLKTVQDSETPPRALTNNTKYFLTAAGVGACALLMAWKFKN